MPGKKRILVFIDWYLPGYKAGGPIRSCNGLVDLLKDTCEISLICRDRDLGDNDKYENIQTDTWLEINGIRIMYLAPSSLNAFSIYNLIRESSFDIIYLNSFFSYYFSILPLWLCKLFFKKRKILLAPRGMLDKEALYIKKRKKQLFLWLTKALGLYKNIIWHVTNENERQSVIRHFGEKSIIRFARNLTTVKSGVLLKNKKPAEARFVYISRIVPIKNLLYAIRLLGRLPVTGKIQFDIYGPVEDLVYWELCRKEIDTLPIHVRVIYKGTLPNQDLPEVLNGYEFFLLPTLNENFGHAIMESLSNGCPVIISNRTPWRNLEAAFAGWDLPLDDEPLFLQVLEKCVGMGPDEYGRWVQGALRKASSYATDPDIILENRNLLQ